MFVDDVNTSATHRLNQIVHTLKHVHGFDLNLDESSVDQIETLGTSSELIKNNIVNESAFNSWHANPDYAKHMLIIEAARIYLKEIAPRRRPRHLKEGTLSTVDNKAARVGRWLIDFAERNSTTDDKLLKVLNGFGRVGDDLINVGDQGKWSSIKDLVDDYENRANNELNDEDDRQLAKDNIHVMRVGFKLYDKHHANHTPNVVDETSVGEVDETSEFAKNFPDLVNMAQEYGVDISDSKMDEGNELSGALASARAAHKDSFTVGGKTYQVHESVKAKLSENHMQSHDYQASMARSELYRNAKYAMDMLKMIHPEDDVEPWIAANLTKDAMYLDKIFHYLDYYTKFEPEQLPGSTTQPDLSALDEDTDELEDTTGTIARQNLIQIFEYSVKLFHMIQPGDKLEGWVAMKLTTASEGISSAKHYLDYKNFERHAADRFSLEESRNYGLKEEISKRDFKLVADLIKKHPDPLARHHMAKHHAEVFAKQNPKFNRGMFFAAANAKEHQKDADMSQFAGSKKKTVKEALDSADQDLQQAETLIAAKSISDDLQSMAEKIARMGVDELMPLVDTMKSQFGPEAADAYNEVMKAQLDALLAATQEAKEQSDNAVLAIQNGGVPGAGMTDIENVPAPTAGAEPEVEEPEGFGTTPAAAGGNEPLGRAKKPAPGEELAEGRRKLGEKWDTEMKTAEKDKGKWDGWTLAKLRSHRKSLMDKETRTAAEQKEVKQIDFAIRAKQKDKFGDVKKEGVEEAKKSKPDFLDMDKDGNKKESMKKAVADKEKAKKVDEAKKSKPDFLDIDKDGNKKEPMKKAAADKAKSKKVSEAKKEKNPYAIGMWQAKKEAGLDPNKPAKDLPKKLITRGHKIARGIEKVDESINRLNALLLKATNGKKILEGQLATHRTEFARMVVEGRTKDVLAHGQGLEGDLIEKKIMEMQKMIKGIETKISDINAESNRRMQAVVEQEQKAYRFAQAKAANPWGVIVENANGARSYKFFKDQQARDYWVQLNSDVNAKLIGPEHFDIAASK